MGATRSTNKKVGERIYLDAFLKAMGWPCTTDDVTEGESPDFIVRVGTRLLGVEVRQVFADLAPRRSKMREGESRRLSWLGEFSRDYYDTGGAPARVQLQFEPGYFKSIDGKVPSELRDRLLERLHSRVTCMKAGATLTSRVRGRHQNLLATMWVMVLPASFGRYTRWRLMNDTMGFVRRVTPEHIQSIVEKKAAKLAVYRRKVPEVALLIVADGFLASGLVQYEGEQVAAHGFEAVYLFHFPEGKVEEVASPPVRG